MKKSEAALFAAVIALAIVAVAVQNSPSAKEFYGVLTGLILGIVALFRLNVRWGPRIQVSRREHELLYGAQVEAFPSDDQIYPSSEGSTNTDDHTPDS
jgi:hypothetical protein